MAQQDPRSATVHLPVWWRGAEPAGGRLCHALVCAPAATPHASHMPCLAHAMPRTCLAVPHPLPPPPPPPASPCGDEFGGFPILWCIRSIGSNWVLPRFLCAQRLPYHSAADAGGEESGAAATSVHSPGHLPAVCAVSDGVRLCQCCHLRQCLRNLCTIVCCIIAP